MDKVILFVIVLGILCKVAFVSSKQCIKYNDCACIFDDDSGMVDLTPIGHNDGTAVIVNREDLAIRRQRLARHEGARQVHTIRILKKGCFIFVDQPASFDTYWYSYNPCGMFYEGYCVNVAVCQYQPANSVFYDIGVPEEVLFNYNGRYVDVQYQSRDGARNTFVTLICDPRATEPVLDVDGVSPTQVTEYYMTLSTIAACPVPTPYQPPEEEEDGLSTGSVLLIIFFVLLFVYLVVGITFNKVWRDVKGIEMIPNSGFWVNLPGLVRDGCAFSVATVQMGISGSRVTVLAGTEAFSRGPAETVTREPDIPICTYNQ